MERTSVDRLAVDREKGTDFFRGAFSYGTLHGLNLPDMPYGPYRLRGTSGAGAGYRGYAQGK
jgi:hypothetical protein